MRIGVLAFVVLVVAGGNRSLIGEGQGGLLRMWLLIGKWKSVEGAVLFVAPVRRRFVERKGELLLLLVMIVVGVDMVVERKLLVGHVGRSG